MRAIIRKEISSFFSTATGYLVIGVFLLVCGLFLWVMRGPHNLLDNGFADLTAFFNLAPWILMFVIPAVCMRFFSEEKKQGTIEILSTKPLSDTQMVLGKFIAALILILIALIPTLIYVYSIHLLGNPIGNLDSGSTLGSYIGLMFLCTSFISIGIFSSSITDNQIVAFIVGTVICLFFYLGIDSIADLFSSESIEKLSLNYHYRSVGQGVLDSRDLIYFGSLAILFLSFSVWVVSKWTNKPISILKPTIVLGALIGLNFLSGFNYARYDLTEDKRFSLNEATISILDQIDSPVQIDVFLDGDDFPAEFRRLRTETRQTLEELAAKNSNINFLFLDPLEDESSREANIQQLNSRGLTPMQLSVQDAGELSQKVIFPWALASYNGVTTKIPLVKNKLGSDQQQLVNNSVQNLEYAFADGLNKLVNRKSKKIAVLKGNGQLQNRYIADLITTLRESYFIAPYTLDSVEVDAVKAFQDLMEFDMIINSKPTEAFTEPEKLVLDQYVIHGGKSMWLIDNVIMEMDSLNNESGSAVAVARDLNLTDFFFRYGIRINPVLIKDLYSAPIMLASGEGSKAQFNKLPWFYSPLVNSEGIDHPIVKNLNLVKFEFANQIDTLKNDITKTLILQSSPLTKLEGVPKEIKISSVTEEPDPEQYKDGNQALSVLLEGEFSSAYKNRILPFEMDSYLEDGVYNAMIVIADGDLIKNEVRKNQVMELGFDPQTGETYGNKEFLLNAVNYLMDDKGLINIRSKDVNISFLNQQKAVEERSKWQTLNVVLPLILLGIFGALFTYFRRKKYS